MSAKFTTGPWSLNMIYGAIRHINKNVEYESFIDEDNSEFQAFQHGKIEFPNVRINPLDANLIAAAPDMYEALKSIENDDNSIPAAIWEMRNRAIAKAEGVEP